MEKFKNTLIIDIDSEAENPVILSKPEETKKPTTVKETVDMMSIDFKTLCVAISEMIYVGHVNGYFDGKEVLDKCIEELEEYKNKLDDRNETKDENV